MRVVVEYVLLENLLINLIILKTCSAFLKEKGRLFLLSAFFCACICVAIPALQLNAVGHVLIQLGQSFVAICLSFKFSSIKKFAALVATYFVCAFVYGGACYFAQNIFGATSILITLAVVVVLFAAISFVLKKANKKRAISNFCYNATLRVQKNCANFDAFLDSGNLLFDPVTNKPVSLINYRVFSALYPHIDISDILLKSEKLHNLAYAHYITLGTLAGGEKILVFQVDEMTLGKNTINAPMLGLCLKGFNQAFGTDIILPNQFAQAAV